MAARVRKGERQGVTAGQLLVFIIGWVGLIFAVNAYRRAAGLIPHSEELTLAPSAGAEAARQAAIAGAPGTGGKGGQGAAESPLENWNKLSLTELQARMQYWHGEALSNTGLSRLPSLAGDRYVIFETDCGGWNNIRMTFEIVVIYAWLTRRVLVLPPPGGMYLLDFGPIVRGKSSDRGATRYSDFFDIEDLRASMPVISTTEFVRREAERLNLPEGLRTAKLESDTGRREWKKWINSDPGQNDPRVNLPWSPLSKVLFFPSIAAVEAAFPEGVPRDFVHHRERVELTPQVVAAPVLSFPSCKDNENYRYLGQVNAIAAFADEALARSYKRMLRDSVHYKAEIFNVAARIVHHLGPFKYVSLHVRRNDLQYKEVFIPAEKSLENVRALLRPGETIYIATDESDPHTFFRAFKDAGYRVVFWQDILDAGVFDGVTLNKKHEGVIEQIVCAFGRFFAGTVESTFSSYIFRLRGYYGTQEGDRRTPEDFDTMVRFHNVLYKGKRRSDLAATLRLKPNKGTIYKSENPAIWTDAVAPHTTW